MRCPCLESLNLLAGMRAASSCRGTTLWELLCVMVVAGILLGIAVPGFQTLALDSAQTADINAFVLAIQLARSESSKRGRTIVLCKSANSSDCGRKEIRYDAGWMVFVNEDEVRPPQRSSQEPLLYVHIPQSAGSISANRARFEFRAFRRRSTNGTVTFCDRRGTSAAKAVIVSYTGRPRVSRLGPGDRALVCAELP